MSQLKPLILSPTPTKFILLSLLAGNINKKAQLPKKIENYSGWLPPYRSIYTFLIFPNICTNKNICIQNSIFPSHAVIEILESTLALVCNPMKNYI